MIVALVCRALTISRLSDPNVKNAFGRAGGGSCVGGSAGGGEVAGGGATTAPGPVYLRMYRP